MLEPSIDSLQEKINSKYSLVTLSAKRARQIREQTGLLEHQKGKTFVSLALEEIQQGKLKLPEDQ